jgi:TrmH family RNA methyltransferase
MLSQQEIKRIRRLGQKKYRKEQGLFIAEGPKVVNELLHSGYKPVKIYSIEKIDCPALKIISYKELERISFLTTPNKVLGIFEIKTFKEKWNGKGLALALEDIRDPGNMGTIIRIADWFGIVNVFCSMTCVDVYNPKVIQATMGSIARVKVRYVELPLFLKEMKSISKELKIYGAVMNGKNIYGEKLAKEGIIIIGNEARGISDELIQYVSDRITIPLFGKAESLNAAVATAIICSEFKRHTIELLRNNF